MGFKFRKSINLGGGFKVNLSKSGVGYSWGTKGVRFTKTATGKKRTTLSVPGTGISYTTESGGKKTTKRSAPIISNDFSTPSPDNSGGKKTSPWINFIVCVCFGCLGVHKFREKKFGMGILYCLTFGLLGVGWVIDSIRYLIVAVKGTLAERADLTQITEEAKNNVVKLLPKKLPELRKLPMKKVLLWALTGLLGLFALVFLPRLSGIIFLMAAALVAPIEKWQNLLSCFVKGKVKTIVVVVMALLALIVTPAAEVQEAGLPDSVVAEVETIAPTEAPTEPPAAVEKISFDSEKYIVGVGRTVDIPFALYPENAMTSTLEVSINNGGIASVSLEKKDEYIVQVTGIIPGEVEITLNAGTDIVTKKTISVTEVMPEGVVVVSEPQKIRVGSNGVFVAEFDPVDVTKRDVTWESDAPDVIKVNEDGSFEAVSIGKATITATHENGASGTLLAEVLPVEAETITLSTNWEEGKYFCKNDSMTLTAVINPENTTDKSVIWSSSDESVATVSDKGVVKAIYPGTAVITAEATNGVKGTYEVMVDVSPQKFRVSASIYKQSNDHVGNSWTTGFEFNDEVIYSGNIVSIMPGETFTAGGWAQENDANPERGDCWDRLTLTSEMCQSGFTIEGEANVRENGGRYSGHYATWYVKMTFTPVN